jgi:hypothetical protein
MVGQQKQQQMWAATAIMVVSDMTIIALSVN